MPCRISGSTSRSGWGRGGACCGAYRADRSRSAQGRVAEGLVDEQLLLVLVALLAAGSRACALGPADAGQLAQRQRPARVEVVPGAHVEGLLLDPDPLGVLVGREGLDEQVVRERVELLDAQDGHVRALLRFPRGDQVVI